MDTIVFTIDHTCGYSIMTTILHIKLCRKNIYDHCLKWGEIKEIFEDHWHFYHLLTDDFAEDDDMISYELYNGYRQLREHYGSDLSGFLKAYEIFFTTNNVVTYYIVRYLKAGGEHESKPESNMVFTDEKKRTYIIDAQNPPVVFMNAYAEGLIKIHKVIEANAAVFSPGSFIREQLLEKGNPIGLLTDYEFLQEVSADSAFTRLLLDDPDVLLINGRLYIRTSYEAVTY